MTEVVPRANVFDRHQAGDSRIDAKTRRNDSAIPIVLFRPHHKFELDRQAMENILLADDIKDRTVVVVSIAGAFRKGKSFLLDFFLRYMYHTYDNDNGKAEDGDWMGTKDQPLDGFSWRGGSDRNTTGILMWSKVFCTTLKNGEKAAIVLLDTQGTFDSESTVRDCATVFALSTMTSSIQIYNVSQNIQEDDLHHLQLFTEYGKLALEQIGKTPFQKLLFLVRDWSYPYEADYGESGGRNLLRKRLRLSLNQHPELQSIRRQVKACFSDIGCFLMPHPGLKVATNPNFDGRLVDVEEDFKFHLKILVESLLSPSNLVSKEIGDRPVRGKDLVQYFQSYVDLYSGSNLPEPKTLLAATAEANNLTAVASAKELYYRLMDDLCGHSKPFVNPSILDKEHVRVKKEAMEHFDKAHKMGGSEYSDKYKSALNAELNETLLQFKKYNQSKNIFALAQTPAVLILIAVASYFCSGLFGLIGVYTLANGTNILFTFTILTLVVWLYVHYTGEMSTAGDIIDSLCSVLLDGIFKKGCTVLKDTAGKRRPLSTGS